MALPFINDLDCLTMDDPYNLITRSVKNPTMAGEFKNFRKASTAAFGVDGQTTLFKTGLPTTRYLLADDVCLCGNIACHALENLGSGPFNRGEASRPLLARGLSPTEVSTMIVTEKILTPYRDQGKASISRLPSSLFTHTSDLYFQDTAGPLTSWPPHPSWPTHDQVRQAIRVVPVLAFLRTVPVFTGDLEWIALQHQCGGYRCVQVSMIATLLTPHASVKDKLDDIGRQFYFAQDGYLDPDYMLASSISSYVQALSAIGLDCECTWRRLSEGLYPIDCTQENLDRIACDAPRLDAMADWQESTRVRYDMEPMILLLAENSD